MPPIPVHLNDPIVPTAAKPDGTTPQTAVPAAAANSTPTPTSGIPTYTAATPTTDSAPPAPQPGAVPTPFTAAPITTTTIQPLQPQPSQPPVAARATAPPPQFTLPPPSDAQLATRSTTTATKSTTPGPTTLFYAGGPPAGGVTHPSPFQSSTTEGHPGGFESLQHPPGYHQMPDNAPYTVGGGGDGGNAGSRLDGDVGEGESGVGAAAWSMLSKAGEALKRSEEAAWKKALGK